MTALGCKHTDIYRCSTCNGCYPCKHKRLFKPNSKLAWVAEGWFWKCPAGKIKPAHIEDPNQSMYLQGLTKKKKKKKRKW